MGRALHGRGLRWFPRGRNTLASAERRGRARAIAAVSEVEAQRVGLLFNPEKVDLRRLAVGALVEIEKPTN